MRKLFLLIVSAFLISTNTFAWERIFLTVNGKYDIRPIGNGHAKSPIQPPAVFIEDYTLSFNAFEDDVVIQLLDGDDVAYEVNVPAGTSSVVLPSTLSGEYTLQLIWGNWVFSGEIEL